MLVAAASAHAQTTTGLETITVTGQQEQDSATYEAPTLTPLDAVQPTSVISQQFIENNIPLSGNYDNIVRLSPSIAATSPNGPGLQENSVLSLRGFQDGQFNVTFDGIPWGDSNDFTHHTTSYFMSNDLGEIAVDRGPGTAATIGNATFGGTVAIKTKDPLSELTLTPYTMQGSFNTQLYGVEVDSGSIAQYGGTKVFLDGEYLDSDGYLTHSGQERENFFLKIAQPVGDNTTITAVAMYNHIHQYVSLGATAAQIAKYGPNYALSGNSDNQDYFGYNLDRIHTDMEYLGVKSDLGDGWHFDDKAYTYGYFHQGLNGEDPNGETPNGTVVGAIVGPTGNVVAGTGVARPNDVPGELLQNDYRSFGNLVHLQKNFDWFDIQTGMWFDHQINSRSLFEVDMSESMAINTSVGGATINPIDRELHQTLDTYQPFLQIDIVPLPGLTLSPGLKYDLFVRDLQAPVNNGTQIPTFTTKDYDAILPSFLVHYDVTSDWAAYAQVAEGFLAPNENVLQIANPAFSNVKPQQSWNYQIGTSYQTKELSASIDAYYIDFSNLIGKQTVGGITEYFNQGGAVYKGIEAEATYYVGYGFSLYGNGSINSAKDKATGLDIAEAPKATAAVGLIYNQDTWYGSLIDKWVGNKYGNAGEEFGFDPYNQLDLSLGYTLTGVPSYIPPVKVKLEVNNLLDSTKIFDLAGTTVADGTPLYWTLPGRSFFVTIAVPLTGTPTASPPMQNVAPTPAEPAPAPVVKTPEAQREFQVFFDFDKSDITDAAAHVIQAAADAVKAGNIVRITVTGHTDTVGSAKYNQALSERRASAVKAGLVADGVAIGEITALGVGKTGLLVPTADGVREPQNRRAEIQLQ